MALDPAFAAAQPSPRLVPIVVPPSAPRGGDRLPPLVPITREQLAAAASRDVAPIDRLPSRSAGLVPIAFAPASTIAALPPAAAPPRPLPVQDSIRSLPVERALPPAATSPSVAPAPQPSIAARPPASVALPTAPPAVWQVPVAAQPSVASPVPVVSRPSVALQPPAPAPPPLPASPAPVILPPLPSVAAQSLPPALAPSPPSLPPVPAALPVATAQSPVLPSVTPPAVVAALPALPALPSPSLPVTATPPPLPAPPPLPPPVADRAAPAPPTAATQAPGGPAPGAPPAVAASGKPADAITIGSFNIQVFGESKIAKPQVVDVLVKIVRGFDVVAVQEVRAKSDSVIPQFVSAINADGSRYAFVIGPRLGRTVSKEQYTFIYDTTRIELDPSSVGTSPNPGDRLHRPPLHARFRTRANPPEAGFS
ncbi:MAG: hypothetical protein RLZZ111_2319, partial [Planctomycetota bacterium]